MPVRGGVVPSPLLLWSITAVALGAAAFSISLAVRSDVPAINAVLLNWLFLAYVFSGLAAWWRRPANRLGPLMVVTGFSFFVSTLWWSDNPVLQTAGQVVDLLAPVLVLHVFLAFPTGRLGGPVERVIVGIGYVAAMAGQLAFIVMGGFGAGAPLAVVDRPAAAIVIHNVALVIISTVALAGVGVLVVRRWVGGRPLRRSYSLVIDSFALGLVMIAVLLLVGAFGGPAFPIVQRISLAILGLAPIAFLVGLLNARLARTAVGDLVVELRMLPADLRAPLAKALGDPSLSVAYWLPEFHSWTDQDGQPYELPTSDKSRATTIIERDGEPVAALVHDPALRDEPELLDAVSAAAGMALENGRLRAEAHAHLDELRGSRVRVLEAGRRERQRLERNLHDGAQQRLVALSLDLGLLEARLGEDAVTKDALAQAKREIALSLDELRTVARGLHPAVLSAHGLGVALESLSARAPVPVHLTVNADERFDEAVEVAAYYVVSESLANIGKHAQASEARVDVAHTDGMLVVEVIDDGVGGADSERGTGLRGLADRVEALGGRLRVWTPSGGGTRVRADIPCG
jgi:signal transduction histidine kinase